MQLRNVNLLNGSFSFELADITFSDRIEKIEPAGTNMLENSIDMEGKILIPGLVDMHTHGAIGLDGMDSTIDFHKWQKWLLSNGITTFLPATVTATFDEIRAALANLKEAEGINLEGPFLSPGRKGAHDETKMVPVDLNFLNEMKDQVRITTIAPEEYDNLDKIKDVVKMGIKVSLGHCELDYDMAKQAFDNGATVVTHIFNAMNGLSHRAPGVVGAALENDNVFCEVIADGIHLHPSVVMMVYRHIGSDRMILISDCMAATGLCDGEYRLGGLHVTVHDRTARTDDGAIAGSTFQLMDMVRSVHKFGVPLGDAVKMATLTPARAVDLAAHVGSIEVGKKANLVVLDADLNIEDVYYLGQKINFED